MKFHGKMADQRNCQREVLDLFEKLASWREESNKEISDIINSHNISLINGINNLVKEVSNLQDELSVIRNERNVLLRTVENLKGEISQLCAKMPNTKPSQEKEVSHILDFKREDASYTKIPDAIGKYDVVTNRNELSDSDYEATSDQDIDQEISNALEDISEDLVCSDCNLAFSSNETYTIHVKNIHAKCDLCEVSRDEEDKSMNESDMTNVEIVDSKPDERAHKTNENRKFQTHIETHIEGKGEKVNDHACKECGKSFSFKSRLKEHTETVHYKIRKFACEECGFTASRKESLKKHTKAVHNKIRNNICEECGYSASEKLALRRHIKAVHDKIKNYNCEECDYSASRKDVLQVHKKAVHDKIRNHICVDCGYSASQRANLRKHVESHHTNTNRIFL